MAESDTELLALIDAYRASIAAGQRSVSSPKPAQPSPNEPQEAEAIAAAAAAAAVSAPALRQESVPPAARLQLSLAEQQRAAADKTAAAAAADRMAQLLMVHSGCVTVCLPVSVDEDARKIATIHSSAPMLRSTCRKRRQLRQPPRVPSRRAGRPSSRKRRPSGRPRLQRTHLRMRRQKRPLRCSRLISKQPPAASTSAAHSWKQIHVPMQAQQESCRTPAAGQTTAGSCVP